MAVSSISSYFGTKCNSVLWISSDQVNFRNICPRCGQLIKIGKEHIIYSLTLWKFLIVVYFVKKRIFWFDCARIQHNLLKINTWWRYLHFCVFTDRNILTHKIGDRWSGSCDLRKVYIQGYSSGVEQKQRYWSPHPDVIRTGVSSEGERHKESRQKPIIRDGTYIQGAWGKSGVMPSPTVMLKDS